MSRSMKPMWAAGAIVAYVALCAAILCSAVRAPQASVHASLEARWAEAAVVGR